MSGHGVGNLKEGQLVWCQIDFYKLLWVKFLPPDRHAIAAAAAGAFSIMISLLWYIIILWGAVSKTKNDDLWP